MSGWLRRWLVHNLWLKLLALGIAVLLWSAVAREPRVEVAHTVPVEFANVPQGLAINTDKVPEVQIWLSGPERVVRGVSPQDLHPVIDLNSISPASSDRTFSLGKKQIKAPEGIEIAEVVPSEFHLSFDVLATRRVPVKPRVTSAGEGFQVVNIATEPPEVTIQGPRSRVNAVDLATTDAIDALGVRGSQAVTVTPYVNDPLVRVLQPSAVRVIILTEKIAR
ncbi:MAG: YbbR-like domain-containing protein [Acidobacteria bacterium]|nr:YbbR-like domain-containing protein [Acidobacteriota bacterium]